MNNPTSPTFGVAYMLGSNPPAFIEGLEFNNVVQAVDAAAHMNRGGYHSAGYYKGMRKGAQ